jgi:hypothetical protein
MEEDAGDFHARRRVRGGFWPLVRERRRIGLMGFFAVASFCLFALP